VGWHGGTGAATPYLSGFERHLSMTLNPDGVARIAGGAIASLGLCRFGSSLCAVIPAKAGLVIPAKAGIQP
jgi:hypothetical protein